MRKALFLSLLLLLFLPACSGQAQAVEVTDEQWDSVGRDNLEKVTEDYLDGVELTEDIDFNQGLAALWDNAVSQLDQILRSATRSGGLVLLICLLCGSVQAMAEGLGARGGLVTLAGVLAVSAVAITDASSLIGLGKETISQIESFTTLLIPAITAAATASGSITGAAVRQMATLLACDVMITVINRLLLPLVYLYLAASAVFAATGNEGLKALSKLVSWVVSGLLGLILAVFTAYLAISGAVSSGADAVTVKVTKLAISGVVPVVGSILSDATETILTGASILRNALGVFGALAVLAFCVAPFLRLGVQYLMYKVVAVLSSCLVKGRLGELISCVGTAFGLVLGMTGACALLVMISLVSTISVAAS